MDFVTKDNIAVEVERCLSVKLLNHMDCVLYNAVTKDDIHVLQGRPSVDKERTAAGSTVLHLACQRRSIKCMQHILSVHKSLLLLRNSTGETALHLAAREGHDDVVAALLNAAKSSLLKLESSQNTSLSLIHFLIRATDVERETALHMAVQYKHGNVVKLLLNEDPGHEYPRNKCGETPLYMASFGHDCDRMTTILDISESPTFGGPNGRTALHAALLNDGGHDCVKLLLEKKRDLIKKVDSYGWTAYHYAANNDLDTIVEDLVAADRSVGYLADWYHGKTALHVATYQGNERVMKKLLEYYPDSWEIVDKNGQNILHIAVVQNQKEAIKLILSHGSKEINKLLIRRDKQGNTPLHLIAKLGCYVPEFMKLKADCEWEVLNYECHTPWDVLQNRRSNTLSGDHTLTRIVLRRANHKRQQYLPLQDLEMEDPENGKNEKQREMEIERKYVERTEKTINTHIIVAALITTVALTAGFAVPGGFEGNIEGNKGRSQGSPVLLKKASFQTFIITDAIALLLSITSLFLYFWTILIKEKTIIIAKALFWASTLLNLFSILAMMLAFITGTYAVLGDSSALANAVCTICSLFFLFIFYVLYKLVIILY